MPTKRIEGNADGKQKQREKARRWYAANKEKAAEKQRRWRETHREKWKAAYDKYNSRPDVRQNLLGGDGRRAAAQAYKDSLSSEQRAEYQRRAYERGKLKWYARGKARAALQAGLLVKPKACELCGWVTEHLQMHHPDHAKPLEVEFLCLICHRMKDGLIRPGYFYIYLERDADPLRKRRGELWLIFELEQPA